MKRICFLYKYILKEKIIFFSKKILIYNNDIDNYMTKNNSKFILKYHIIFVVKYGKNILLNTLNDIKLNYTDNFGRKNILTRWLFRLFYCRSKSKYY